MVLACWWVGQVLTWLAAVVPGLEPGHWCPRPVLQQLPVGALGILGLVPPTGRWSCVPGSLVVGPWWSQSWCQPSGGLGQNPGGSGSDASLLIRALSPDTAGCVPGGPMAGIYPLVGGTRSSTAGSSEDPMATGLLVGGVVSLPS